MTEIERLKQKKLKEEAEKKEKSKKISKDDYSSVITEDGTLASFNFNDNYKTR